MAVGTQGTRSATTASAARTNGTAETAQATEAAGKAQPESTRSSALAAVSRHWAPLVVGLLAAAISGAGAGNASYWGDEAASVMSAERSIPNLFALLGNIDAVHGLYYLFLHVWTGLAGTAEFAVRAPNAVAVGLAAAGTVMLGRQLFGHRVGLVAGLVFAVIPQVTMMGQEARSYAFGMAAAVWLTNWFVAVVRRGDVRRRTWVLYGAAVAASLYLFLYLALLGLVHAAVLLAFRPTRGMLTAWARSLVLAALLAAPIIFFGLAQRGQIGFLARRNYANAESVSVGQWFTSPWFAAAAWVLMGAGLVAVALRGSRQGRRGVAALAVWAFAPTALLLAGNAWVTPMYNLRYVAFCTPAVALLVALGVTAVAASLGGGSDAAARRDYSASPATAKATAVTIALLTAIAVLAAPVYLAQRGPFGKDGGSDLRQTADAIARNAQPGDAVVFAEEIKPSQKPRLSIDLYPDRFVGLDDVALITPFSERDSLWDEVREPPATDPLLLEHGTVWAVQRQGRPLDDIAALQALGFHAEQMIPVNRTVIYKMVRDAPELP